MSWYFIFGLKFRWRKISVASLISAWGHPTHLGPSLAFFCSVPCGCEGFFGEFFTFGSFGTTFSHSGQAHFTVTTTWICVYNIISFSFRATKLKLKRCGKKKMVSTPSHLIPRHSSTFMVGVKYIIFLLSLSLKLKTIEKRKPMYIKTFPLS